MTCMEAQALITPFINDNLDVATLEQFVDHVDSCKECKEELEVYYALLTAMKQLDEDEEVSADYAKELENKLEDAREFILRTKIIHIRKRILFFVVVIFVGLFTSVSVNVVEEVLTISKETEFNTFVIKNEVLSPYMSGVLLDGMEPYQQVQDELERVEEEVKKKEVLKEEERKKREDKKRQEQIEAATETANAAIANEYESFSPYSRDYEQASDLMKLRYEKEDDQQRKQGIPVNSPLEYSR